MAEKEPVAERVLKDERDVVVKLQQQLERAQQDVARKEVFGKYDVTVPGEGELNYQEYLEKRPAEGVVRDGGDFRDAQSGRYSSAESYEAQRVSSQDYYDKIGGLVNKAEYQPPDYESMGVLQLAKETAKARRLGDRAEEAQILEAVHHYLTADAMKDDTESPEQAQARFDADVARYDSLVSRFLGRPDVHAQQAGQAHAEPSGEGEPSARVVSQGSDAEPVVSTGADDKGDIDKVGTPEPIAEPKEPGKDLELHVGEQTSDATPQSGKELELYAGEIEPEKVKKWWQKAGERIRGLGGVSEWAAGWTDAGVRQFEVRVGMPLREKMAIWLEHGVDKNSDENEQAKKRMENRYIAGAGGVAVALIALGTAYLIAKGVSTGGGANTFATGLENTDNLTPAHMPGLDAIGDIPTELGGMETGADTILPAPEISPEAMSIGGGEGGLAFFERLGLDAEVWRNNASTLVDLFPQDFYREGNDVRIAHPGQLSQDAQDFIKTLVRQG